MSKAIMLLEDLRVDEAKYENASGGKISDAAIRDTGKLLKELADDFDWW